MNTWHAHTCICMYMTNVYTHSTPSLPPLPPSPLSPPPPPPPPHTHTQSPVTTHHTFQEKLAPNVLAMVQSFNQLALLVPTEILSEETHQQRAKVISAYIQVHITCIRTHKRVYMHVHVYTCTLYMYMHVYMCYCQYKLICLQACVQSINSCLMTPLTCTCTVGVIIKFPFRFCYRSVF